MAGTVDIFFDNLGSSLSLHQGGKLRILGVCGPERSPSLPDIPTAREAGVHDFTSTTWFVLMAPKNTSPEILAKINAAVSDILREPDIRAKFAALGVESAPMSLQGTAAFIESERAKWGGIIRFAQIAIE